MGAWKYKRIMPKVIVAKLRLIEAKDIVDLIGKSLDYICSKLMKTTYGAEISTIPLEQISSISLENAFLRNFMKTCEEIMAYSPKDIKFLLSTLLMKFEVSNIKAMLRAKEAGIDTDKAMRYIVGIRNFNEVRCRKILEKSKDVEDIAELLLDSEYGFILKVALGRYKETKLFLMLEIALDKFVYSKIWEASEKLKGTDKGIARTILGLEIESMNIKTILRCKAMGIHEDLIGRYLIPVSRVFGRRELEGAIKAVDLKSSIESLLMASRLALNFDYWCMLNSILKEYESSHSLSRLEIILDKGLLRTSLRMLRKYAPFFNIGLILAFLNLKWFEVRNLRAIVKGAEDRISPEIVRGFLILPD
jgi:V/A-type H+-transporting ATPase subunit C